MRTRWPNASSEHKIGVGPALQQVDSPSRELAGPVPVLHLIWERSGQSDKQIIPLSFNSCMRARWPSARSEHKIGVGQALQQVDSPSRELAGPVPVQHLIWERSGQPDKQMLPAISTLNRSVRAC